MIPALIRVRRLLFVSALTIVLSSSAQAASITLDANGILVGAKDVIVNGSLYDVAFLEGTCAEVFGVCDAANFAFTTESDANAASFALFGQVFLDVPQGNFNTDVTLTYGCKHPSQTIDQCFAYTPFGDTFTDPFAGLSARISVALNTAYPLAPVPSIVDLVFASNYGSLWDTRNDPEGVYAKWTPVAQSVPDATSTLTLAALSIAIMLAQRRSA
jgi:hypothetical protein